MILCPSCGRDHYVVPLRALHGQPVEYRCASCHENFGCTLAEAMQQITDMQQPTDKENVQ